MIKLALVVFIFCGVFTDAFPEKCRLLQIYKGESVNSQFVPLEVIDNDPVDDEIFRYQFRYNVSTEHYLIQMYLTNASYKDDLQLRNKHWITVFSDEDSDAGYASLGDQTDEVFDSSPNQLKIYDGGKIFLDFVLSKNRVFSVQQPDRKEDVLNAGTKRYPHFRYIAFEIRGGDMSFYYNCKPL